MRALKISLMLLFAVALASIAATAIPISIDKVEVDGTTLSAGQAVRLDVLRGDEVSVRVQMTAQQSVDNVELLGFISGFEHNDIPSERLTDNTDVMHMDANVTYVRTLKLKISPDVQVDDYKLRLVVSDRYSDDLTADYDFKIDTARHALAFKDVIMTPGTGKVKAGEALVVKARVANKGQKTENDVKVTATIPDLGVQQTGYINQIKSNDDQEESEELYLRIPKTAAPGIYTMVVDVDYNDLSDKQTYTSQIEVLDNPALKDNSASDQPKGPETVLVVGSQLETFEQGGSAIYPITITNNGKTTKSYSVSVKAPDGIGIEVSPSTTIVLDSSRTQTLYLFANADANAPAGPQVITATITSGTDAVQQLSFTANIKEVPASMWKTALTVVFIALVVLLVIIGLVIGFSRLRSEERQGSEPYY